MNLKPKVCVIGAGVAGLASARYLKEADIQFTVLEATDHIGGTWYYDSRVGVDEYGEPIRTSMYKNLRTNLPKQIMEFLDFKAPESMRSYPSHFVYYEYLQNFTKHFELESYIKFRHLVLSVKRNQSSWIVKHTNLVTKDVNEEHFDFIFVCNGHHSKPYSPDIPGKSKFKGTIIHSHDYRVRDIYKNRKVLLIGAGPSGMDISLDVAEVAHTLYHSHHSPVKFNTPFPSNFIQKPDVKELTEDGALFVDGTEEKFDDIMYCTGYDFSYPFLDDSSGLTFNERYVSPLYQQMVNINNPSMFLIGLIERAALVAAIDAQARYATALVNGSFMLPIKEDMMRVWQSELEKVKETGRPMSAIHFLSEREDLYYEEIAKESGTARVPPVIFKIRRANFSKKVDNLYTYRNYEYDIIDRENFVQRLENYAVDQCVGI